MIRAVLSEIEDKSMDTPCLHSVEDNFSSNELADWMASSEEGNERTVRASASVNISQCKSLPRDPGLIFFP